MGKRRDEGISTIRKEDRYSNPQFINSSRDIKQFCKKQRTTIKFKKVTDGICFHKINSNRYYYPSHKPVKELGITEGLLIWEGIRNDLTGVEL